jgi:diguanylate cyclase (GGDEF)-like protein
VWRRGATTDVAAVAVVGRRGAGAGAGGRRRAALLAVGCGLAGAAQAAGAGSPAALSTAPPAAATSEREAGRLAERYFHRGWRRGDGLPGNSVYDIVQSADGYLWIGTENGLARFDGQRFVAYGNRPPGVFRSRYVAALVAARDGTLWIGTERGLLRMRGGVVSREGAAGGPTEVAITSLAEDPGGDLWIGTRSGLLRRRAATGAVSRVGLAGVRVTQLLAGEAGEVWIGTDERGPWRMRAGRLAPLSADPGFAQATVAALVRDQDGSILVFTGLAVGRFVGGNAVRRARADLAVVKGVTAGGAGRGGLWLATIDRGVVLVAGGRSWFASREHPLATAATSKVFVAADGTVWLGTAGDGLRQLVEKSCRTYTRRDGLASDVTSSVLAEADGTFWVGTLDGVVRMTRRRGGGAVAAAELKGTVVRSLLRDRQGTLWAGTSRGLARRTGARWEFLPPCGGPATLEVNAMLEDRLGNLWVGTTGGLGRLPPASTQAVLVHGLEGQEITSLATAGDGALWVGTRGAGLLRLRDGRLETLRTASDLPIVTTVRRGQAGDMWVGSFGNGLLHYRAGRWFRFDEGNGLADATVRQVRETEDGSLWICSGAGISRVARGAVAEVEAGRAPALIPASYGPEDGVAEAVCYFFHPGVARSADGHLWFATNHGLVEIRPERLAQRAASARPRLDGVTVDGREWSGRRPFKLSVPGSFRRVDFRFSAPVFVGQARTAFRYRLAGFDVEWFLDGGERLARYTSLDAGSYRFEVELRDEQRGWSAPESLAEIEVRPLLYQRPAFAVVVGLALLGTAIGIFRLSERRLLRRAAELEFQVRTRTTELQAANQRLAGLATLDALTGLANRRLLEEALEREVRRASRNRREISVVMVDVDYFKRYNDSLGHVGGDECLRRVAMALRAVAARPGDLVARYGGEEFALLLPETTAQRALEMAEALCRSIGKLALPHPSSPAAPHVTVSAGVAGMVPEAGSEPAALIAAADAALYQAKQRGRNQARAAEGDALRRPAAGATAGQLVPAA